MEMTCFDHFPEPVFYIQSGRLQYSNAAALALEPQWTAGAAIPEALGIEPDENGVFSCRAGNREFQAAVTQTQEGRLVVLRPAVKAPVAGALQHLPGQLREMLNGLQGAMQLMTAALKEGEGAEIGRYLSVMQQNFYRLLRVTWHLELADRAGREDVTLVEKMPLDLAEVCREMAYGARKLAQQAKVTLREDVPGGILATLGDRALLEIMLLELLSNAIKAAPKGGEAGIRLTSNANRVQITVWDNGPGMSQADLTALMDGDAPESLPKPGTGLRLGLPIARYGAAAHGGAVLLESREGEGMRVTVSLPLQKVVRSAMYTPQVRAEESFSPLMTLLSDALPGQAFEE